MFDYRKKQLMLLLVLGLLGGSAIGWADESANSHPSAGQSANENGNPDLKPPRGLYGPMSFSYVEIEDLKLSDKQEALWQKAQDKTNEALDRAQTINRDLRDQVRVDLDKPGADLKQMIQRQEEARIKIETAFKQARKAWFTAYDALDANQKEQLREAIRAGMDAVQASSLPAPPPPPPPPPSPTSVPPPQH
jgi:hypothetical protein